MKIQLLQIMSNDSTPQWNQVWGDHNYVPYSNLQPKQYVPCNGGLPDPTPDQLSIYGTPTTVAQYAERVQIVNYTQYKSLYEGFSAYMWQW